METRRTLVVGVVAGCLGAVFVSGVLHTDAATAVEQPAEQHSLELRGLGSSHSAHSAGTRQISTHQLPVVVDGSENPDLIPDRLAYLHFFSAVARLDRVDAPDAEARDSYLERVALSDDDTSVILAEAAEVREQLDAVRVEQQVMRSARFSAGLSVDSEAIVDEARSRMFETLTPDGYDRLETFVQEQVKPRIVIRRATMR